MAAVSSRGGGDLLEHKNLFSEWLNTLKSNSIAISAADLESIRTYLLALRDGSAVGNLNKNLKKRMNSSHMFLTSFPSSTDCVCSRKAADGSVCLHRFVYLLCRDRLV